GYNTYLNDNPQLTNRLYPGKSPIRIILERNSVIINEESIELTKNREQQLPHLMEILYEKNIQSVMVEGGRKTLDRFIAADLVDEMRVLIGNQVWGNGTLAPQIFQAPDEEILVRDNKIKTYLCKK
ncbi:MAG: dihydrofolate reductase family protein, partial [Bacteroidales bacterium]|nr:dihydrofolate reductase family protein [Bacteroidales bacterium]